MWKKIISKKLASGLGFQSEFETCSKHFNIPETNIPDLIDRDFLEV